VRYHNVLPCSAARLAPLPSPRGGTGCHGSGRLCANPLRRITFDLCELKTLSLDWNSSARIGESSAVRREGLCKSCRTRNGQSESGASTPAGRPAAKRRLTACLVRRSERAARIARGPNRRPASCIRPGSLSRNRQLVRQRERYQVIPELRADPGVTSRCNHDILLFVRPDAIHHRCRLPARWQPALPYLFAVSTSKVRR